MNHARKLFVNEYEDEQYNVFCSHHWYSHGFEFFPHTPRCHSGNFYPLLLGFHPQ